MTNSECIRLMRAALQEAILGMKSGEVPIGCVIAMRKSGELQIIARGHNKVNRYQRKIAHAEIVTFENASRLNRKGAAALPLDAQKVVLVSTLEPCVMCLGAAMEAGIQTVVYGLRAPADNGTQRVKPPTSPESSNPEIIGNILALESRSLFIKWLDRNPTSAQAQFVRQLLTLTSKENKTKR